MPRRYRRYELLLPTSFNDGSTVPDELIGQTFRDVRKKFGAVSVETQYITGYWEQTGVIYRDTNIRMFVDVADTPENQEFFVVFKERLKERFQQIDIWMTAYPVDVI